MRTLHVLRRQIPHITISIAIFSCLLSSCHATYLRMWSVGPHEDGTRVYAVISCSSQIKTELYYTSIRNISKYMQYISILCRRESFVSYFRAVSIFPFGFVSGNWLIKVVPIIESDDFSCTVHTHRPNLDYKISVYQLMKIHVCANEACVSPPPPPTAAAYAHKQTHTQSVGRTNSDTHPIFREERGTNTLYFRRGVVQPKQKTIISYSL